jgi:hypothetical protein
MRHVPCPLMVSAIVIAALTSAARGQLAATADPGFAATEAQENAANGKPGPRTVPGRAIPVPDTVSPQLRAAIAAPYRVPAWDADPKETRTNNCFDFLPGNREQSRGERQQAIQLFLRVS